MQWFLSPFIAALPFHLQYMKYVILLCFSESIEEQAGLYSLGPDLDRLCFNRLSGISGISSQRCDGLSDLHPTAFDAPVVAHFFYY